MSWLRTTGLRLLLAIGLGFALWVFVSFTENPEQTSSFAEVPVEIEGIASRISPWTETTYARSSSSWTPTT